MVFFFKLWLVCVGLIIVWDVKNFFRNPNCFKYKIFWSSKNFISLLGINIDSNIVTFFNDCMGLVMMELNNINFDDYIFDKDDRINLVLLDLFLTVKNLNHVKKYRQKANVYSMTSSKSVSLVYGEGWRAVKWPNCSDCSCMIFSGQKCPNTSNSPLAWNSLYF